MTTETKGNKKIRKGDKVIAISGNYRTMSGVVLSCKGEKAIVQGINVRKRHTKGQGTRKGEIVSIERPIHISNLKLCTEEGKPFKAHVRTNNAGEKELYYNDGDRQVVHRSMKKSSK